MSKDLFMNIIKRNKEIVPFDGEKVRQAIKKAMISVYGDSLLTDVNAKNLSLDVFKSLKDNGHVHNVEEVQTVIELTLLKNDYYKVAREYMEYRRKRNLRRMVEQRNQSVIDLLNGENEELNKENSNKNTMLLSTQRDYMAGILSKEIVESTYPKEIVEADKEGVIHIHDKDYIANRMINCGLVNLKDMFENETVINGIRISEPKSFLVACNVASQIVAMVASSQLGGQSITLTHLAKYVRVSKEKIENGLDDPIYCSMSDYSKEEVVKRNLKKEIKDGCQLLMHQILTLQTSNGQSPFLTLFMYLNETKEYKEELAMIIEELLLQRIEGLPNEKGVNVTVAFPKLVYVLEEDNIHDDSKYYYLTKLAAECTTKRLVPDYVSEKEMKSIKEGNCFPPMGCRAMLSPYKDEEGNYVFYSRFNQGVVTLNLADVALSSKGDIELFNKILDERLSLCYEALMLRHKTLLGTKSDTAPILWQHGAYARLKKGETIDKLLYGNYSTISLGYAGLYECVKYMTQESHTSGVGKEFGLYVMKKLNLVCDIWKANTNIGFGLYGTPIESTTQKFADNLQRRFGIIAGITDKRYITNSYHVTPSEKIDAFSKLSIESEYQKLSVNGCISYIETPNMTKNIDAIISVMKYIYDNIMYAEINTMTSYCHECGCADIRMNKKEDGGFEFECPSCENKDFNKLNIAVRVCGYISTNPFNDGRANDIYDRVYHIGEE